LNKFRQEGKVSHLRVIQDMWYRLGNWKSLYIIAISLHFTQSAFHIGAIFVNDKIFTLLSKGDFESVKMLLVWSSVALIVLFVSFTFADYLKQIVLTAVNRDYALDLADHAQRLPLATTECMHSGDLFQRISRDSGSPSSVLSQSVDQMVPQIVIILLSSFYMINIYWPLAIMVLVFTPIMLLIGHFIRKKLQKVGRQVADQEAIVRTRLQDSMQNMEVIRVYMLEQFFLSQFVVEKKKLNSLYMKSMFLNVTSTALSYSVAMFLTLFCVAIVAILASQNLVDVGQVIAFFMLIWRVNNPMRRIGELLGAIKQNLGIAERAYNLLNLEKEPLKHIDDEPLENDLSLKMHEINFSYNLTNSITTSETALLHRFSFHAEKGNFIAIVGASGSGKSTVGKLLAGLYFPEVGEVNIKGRLTSENAELARSIVAYVPQTPYLFSGTILENIRLGNPKASDEEVQQAAKDSQAHDFICELPDTYNTILSEHGISLSGGQRQRIAIAQTLVSNRPIWILDEATSALDQDTEKAVMNAILKQKENHIVIVIAHRLSTVLKADRIYVMENGHIKEIGTHEMLMNQHESTYQRFWAKLSV